METESDTYRYRMWYTFARRGMIANLKIRVTKCVFPCAGRYNLTLLFDGVMLSERPIEVIRGKGGS